MKKFTSIMLAIIIFFLCILPSNNTSAETTAPMKNIYSEGLYKVSDKNGDFPPGDYKFELISKDTICYVYIIDKAYIQRYSKRFDYSDYKDSYSLSTVGTFLEGDTIIIYGNGEIYFTKIN